MPVSLFIALSERNLESKSANGKNPQTVSLKKSPPNKIYTWLRFALAGKFLIDNRYPRFLKSFLCFDFCQVFFR